MTLTPAGAAAGFSLSTFASNFPMAPNSLAGPLGIAFPKTGGVLVADYNGQVRGFGDTDNLDAQAAVVTADFGAAAPTGMIRADGTLSITADPNNGSLLVTQSDSVLRLSPPSCGPFPTPDQPVRANGGYVVHSVEGAPSGIQGVANFTDPDGPNAASQYPASINWGDGQVSAGTISGPDGNGVCTVLGNHAYAEEGGYPTSGAAFGVPNNTVLNIYQILKAANNQAVNGVLYNGNTTLQDLANTIFDGVNQSGDIG